MALQTAKVSAKGFKELIRDVLKFPPSASVAASEIVHFAISKGRARASVSGLTVSSATVMATSARDIDAFTADYRGLQAYAKLLPEDATVDVELSTKDKQVLMICGEEKLTLALTLGDVLPKPKMPEPFFEATEETARALKWLASVAEKDETKPDMCCVYLKDGVAMAGNQKCIAVARTPGLPKETLPLPLSLCTVLEPGDKLARGNGGLMVQSGSAVIQVPFLVQSLQFPVDTVARLEDAKGDVYGTCKASDMVSVFKISADCVARIPKTEAYLVMSFKGEKINIRAQSQTAAFRTVLAGKTAKDGDLWIELPEGEEALTVFGDGDVVCKKLTPKGETALEGSEAKAYFAPVKNGAKPPAS